MWKLSWPIVHCLRLRQRQEILYRRAGNTINGEKGKQNQAKPEVSTWPTCPRGLFTVRLPALALSISVPKPACLRALQHEVELRRPGSWRNVFGDRFLGFPFLSTWASLGEERRLCRPLTDFFFSGCILLFFHVAVSRISSFTDVDVYFIFRGGFLDWQWYSFYVTSLLCVQQIFPLLFIFFSTLSCPHDSLSREAGYDNRFDCKR